MVLFNRAFQVRIQLGKFQVVFSSRGISRDLGDFHLVSKIDKGLFQTVLRDLRNFTDDSRDVSGNLVVLLGVSTVASGGLRGIPRVF